MSDTIEQYYEATGARYRMSSTRRARVLSLLDQAIDSVRSESISLLDIGIGSGEVAEHCRQGHSEKRQRIVGIDISEKLLAAHRHLYDETAVGNVDAAGWQQPYRNSFDIVVASELVEHLFRPDVFFATVRDVLKPKGYLVLSTPNMLLWSQRIKFLLGRHEWSDGGVFEWGHIHLFSWGFLTKELSRNSFAIVSTQHLLYPNRLAAFSRFLPTGLFAFQFIVLAQKK